MEATLRGRLREEALGLVHVVAKHLPDDLLRQLVANARADLEIALCLHRVTSARRPLDPYPPATIEPEKLDALIELLGPDARLTLTFDDGYADAAAYIASRAARYPRTRWIYFLCPEKTEKQIAFRWNAFELEFPGGSDAARVAFERADLDRSKENSRPDLTRVARYPEFRLATVEECQRLRAFPTVSLGNHTNTHFPLARMRLEDAEAEIRESMERFEGLFGPCEDFAFPYGVPGQAFGLEHVAELRKVRPNIRAWSTVGRPFRDADRSRGRVLPRFPINGQWSAQALALWIAIVAGRFRAGEGPTASGERAKNGAGKRD